LRIVNTNFSSADYDYCSKKHIGYKPVDVMEAIDGTDFNTAGRKTANALTGSFILHPIACGLTFIAALVAVGGVVGSLFGTILGVLAWILTVVVMAIDFAIFGVCFTILQLQFLRYITDALFRALKTTLTKTEADRMRSTALACGHVSQP
jgi:hypothetical protein